MLLKIGNLVWEKKFHSQFISGNSERSRVFQDDVTKNGFVDVCDVIGVSVQMADVVWAHVGGISRDVIGSIHCADADADLMEVPELVRPGRPVDGDVVVGLDDPSDLGFRLRESLKWWQRFFLLNRSPLDKREAAFDYRDHWITVKGSPT